MGMELRHPNLVATWGFITVPPGHHVLPEFYGGLSTPNTALAKAAAWPIPSQVSCHSPRLGWEDKMVVVVLIACCCAIILALSVEWGASDGVRCLVFFLVRVMVCLFRMLGAICMC